MSIRPRSLAAATLVAVGLSLASHAAVAAPITGVSAGALAARSTDPGVVDVRWRRGWGWGVGAGIVGGVIIGHALTAPHYYRPYYARPYYYPGPVYYRYRTYSAPTYYREPAYEGYDDDVAYCMRRFRSYDPRSGTYLGYDGYRHPCP